MQPSLERKVLLALAALLLLLTFALSSTAYVSVRRAAERATREGMSSAVGAVSELFAAAVPRVLAQTGAFATRAALPESLGAQEGEEHAAARALLQERAREPNVLGVELRDLAGRRRLAAGLVAASPPVPPSAVGGGLGSGAGGAAVGRLRALGGSAALPVVVPLEAGGKRVGHLVEWRKVVLGIRLTGSRFLLGNRDGELWTDGMAMVPRPPIDLSHTGIVSYEGAGGADTYATAFPIPDTPWVGVIEMPAEARRLPVRRFLGRMATVAGILFAASLALAWWWSRRITRPLGELARAADAIAGGDLTQRVRVARRDELGRLEIAFNHMAGKLAASQSQLERRVVELRQTQEQFTRAQRMEVVGLLAGGVAHDFNNLLTIILGEAEMALGELEPDSPARQSLVEIAAAGERAAALTRQLLVFSRGQVLEPAAFDVHDVLEDTARMVRRLLNSNVEVALRPAPEPLPVRADRGQIEQVIMNLVVNARDAMPSGGRIYLEAQRVTLDAAAIGLRSELPPGEYVALVVSDTGAGMSEEVKGRLFEPFFSTKQPGKGTGLGLPACRGIVERWGGHIAVYSEQGVGTTVKAYFPLLTEPGEPGGVTDSATAPVPGGSEAVLVVDDEPAVRELASRILRAQGYRVLEASDGDAALGIVAASGVELLITDVVLPGTSGREIAERAVALRPGLRVLFMSGYTEDVVLQRRLLEQDVALLQKPFTAEKLARRAREALDGWAA